MITPIDWSVVDKSALDPQQLAPRERHRLLQPVDERLLQQEEMAGCRASRTRGRISGTSRNFPAAARCGATRCWTIEAAAKADGVKDDAFYPLDVDRVFRSLDRIKPHIKTWWSDNSQSQQLMEQDEVDLIHMTNGRATQSILDHNAPVRDGLERGDLCRPRRRLDRAGRMPQSERRDEISRLHRPPRIPGGVRAPALLRAAEPQGDRVCSTPTLAKLMPSYPDNEKIAHIVDYEWWADNIARVQRRFEQWLQS